MIPYVVRSKFIAEDTPDNMKISENPIVKQFIYGLADGPLTERRRAEGYEDDLLGAAKKTNG